MTKTYQKYRFRITLLSVFIIASWAMLGARLFYIQVLHGDVYRRQGFQQGQARLELPALRGNIFDRDETALTRNIIQFSIGVHPSTVSDRQAVADLLASCTGKSPDEYLRKMESSSPFVYLERNLQRETCTPILTNRPEDLVIERHARRYYPHETIASQLIGFTDVDDKGITGVEKQFDRYLHGASGWIIKERNGMGAVVPRNGFPTQPPVDGHHIQLTIDLEYQSILQEELNRRVEETASRSGTGVIVDPQTGAILAMASAPDFNPNQPTDLPTENQKIRAITDQFEPGSTFKIVATTAALDLHTVSLKDEFNCEFGAYEYSNIRITDHEDYGLLTVPQIVAHSSNVGMIKIAETLGKHPLYRFARDYGFGMPTRINLLGESPGTLRQVDDWSSVSLAELSMGHEVGVTALQLAMAYSAIANGGYLLKPHLIKQIFSTNGDVLLRTQPDVVRQVAQPATIAAMNDILQEVVEYGTGTAANIAGWAVAGKTGTAQKFMDSGYSKSKFTSNFVGFLPADNPQLLAVIVLDEPRYGYHWGGVGAAVVFRRTMERIINMDDSITPPARKRLPQQFDQPQPVSVQTVQPVDVQVNRSLQPIRLSSTATVSSVAQATQNTPPIVPEVRGMSLRKALLTLCQADLVPEIRGSGKVVTQSPAPGIRVQSQSTCRIRLQ